MFSSVLRLRKLSTTRKLRRLSTTTLIPPSCCSYPSSSSSSLHGRRRRALSSLHSTIRIRHQRQFYEVNHHPIRLLSTITATPGEEEDDDESEDTRNHVVQKDDDDDDDGEDGDDELVVESSPSNDVKILLQQVRTMTDNHIEFHLGQQDGRRHHFSHDSTDNQTNRASQSSSPSALKRRYGKHWNRIRKQHQQPSSSRSTITMMQQQQPHNLPSLLDTLQQPVDYNTVYGFGDEQPLETHEQYPDNPEPSFAEMPTTGEEAYKADYQELPHTSLSPSSSSSSSSSLGFLDLLEEPLDYDQIFGEGHHQQQHPPQQQGISREGGGGATANHSLFSEDATEPSFSEEFMDNVPARETGRREEKSLLDLLDGDDDDKEEQVGAHSDDVTGVFSNEWDGNNKEMAQDNDDDYERESSLPSFGMMSQQGRQPEAFFGTETETPGDGIVMHSESASEITAPVDDGDIGSFLSLLDDDHHLGHDDNAALEEQRTDETMLPITNEEIMVKGMAFLSAMSQRNWARSDETNDDGNDRRGGEEEIIPEEEVVLDDDEDKDEIVIEDSGEQITHESSDSKEYQIEDFISRILNDEIDYDFTADDFNSLLLYLATSPAYSNHDGVSMMLELFQHMQSLSSPSSSQKSVINSNTLAILIPALYRKGRSPSAASDLALKMLRPKFYSQGDDYSADNGDIEALVQAIWCMEQCRRVDQARSLYDAFLQNEGSRQQMPIHAITSMIRLYQHMDRQEDARELIECCLKEDMRLDYPKLTDIFLTILMWPEARAADRNRVGNTTPMMEFVLEKVVQSMDYGYRPTPALWSRLLKRLVTDAYTQEDHMLVQKTFVLALEDNLRFCPNPQLLKLGLQVAKTTEDARLAVDLVRRVMKSRGEDNRGVPLRRISPQTITLAMQVCCESSKGLGSMEKLTRLIPEIYPSLPKPTLQELACHRIKAYARAGQTEEARDLLSDMGMDQLVPSDEALGALIHSYAQGGAVSKSLHLFDQILDGHFGQEVRPGLACYNAKVFTLMRLKDWDGILRLFEQMRFVGVAPSPLTSQGVLLAASYTGNTLEILQNALVADSMEFDQVSFEQAAKTLLPDLMFLEGRDDNGGKLDFEVAQEKLRRLSEEENDGMREQYLQLLSALRTARWENERLLERNRPVGRRGQKNWAHAVQCLVNLVNAKGPSEKGTSDGAVASQR